MDIRSRYLVSTIIAWTLLALFVYVQSDVALMPSPMLLLNTVCLALLCLILLLVTWICPRKTGQHVFGLLLIVIALMGITITLRQFWFMHHLPQEPFCFVDQAAIWATVQQYGMAAVIQQAWFFGANCPHGMVTFFGLTPELVYLIFYFGLIMLVLWQLYHVRRFGAHGHK